METIKSLAAFDPDRLAAKLASQPDGARVVALMPTGPVIALPKDGNYPAGAFVYDDTKVYVYCDNGVYETVAELADFDGKPYLCWRSFRERMS